MQEYSIYNAEWSQTNLRDGYSEDRIELKIQGLLFAKNALFVMKPWAFDNMTFSWFFFISFWY